VKAGKKTEDEILGEFLDTFEDHFCDMKGHEDARDGGRPSRRQKEIGLSGFSHLEDGTFG